MKKSLVIILMFCSVLTAQKLIKQPSLNNDGSQIAFTYQGDIWIVSSAGGEAKRITVHSAYETNPKFSKDGNKIFFSSNRYGNNDIFMMNLNGEEPVRLTYNSAQDNISSVTADNEILFTTNRENQQIERLPEIFSVSASGGTESKKISALGLDPVLSPDGKLLAFTRGSNTIFREAYDGTANKDIWLYSLSNKKFIKIADSNNNEYMPQWLDSKTLLYLSAEKGKYNIFKIRLNDKGEKISQPEQITFFKDFAVRSFSVSYDGKVIAIEQGLNVYIVKNDSKPEKIDILLPLDFKNYPEETKVFSKDAEEYSVSPNGKLVAFSVHGEIFIKEIDKEKNRSVNISNSSYRETEPVWLNDSTLIFASDREENNYDLYLCKSSDKSQGNLFKTLKREIVKITATKEDENSVQISNDMKKISFVRGNGKLIVADISKDGKISNEKILLDGWATPNGICWSPDNKYLAYSLEDLFFNEEIYIHPVDNSFKPVNVSMHPRSDSNPVWSPDGSKLFFLSSRDNRNGVGGGLSRFNDIWFAWLSKSDWEKTKQDWEDVEKPKEEKSAKKDSKKDSTAVKNVKIDFENIYKRLVQVTSFPTDESNIQISKDGDYVYFIGANTNSKGNDIFSIKWDGKELKEITKGGSNPKSLSMDKDRKYLYFFKNDGMLNRQEIKSDKPESLPYSAKMKIDFNTEKNQIFEEAWRELNNKFYDPDFHGHDWKKLHDKYKPLCMAASTSADFREIFNYMLGELNSSHMGMFGEDKTELQKEITGNLGAELSPLEKGMKVERVIPNTPADRDLSKLSAGDVITSVDGIKITKDINFYSLLNNRENENVVLTVKSKNGNEREVVIRTSENIRQDLYNEWVEERKKLTDEYSKGRLGYIHIQGMSMNSFELFERELAASGNGKDGLVIDVRFNGGGSTTDYLMTILNYKQHAYTIPRGAANNLEKEKLNFRDYYPTGERLVYSAWLKPSIAICNEDSYSNAEIFSHAYKQLKIGTLVGNPTNGSVISTGGKTLIDGSLVRTPMRGWFTKATDKNQELGPAVPDIIVENNIDKSVKDDEQLKAAVMQLLKEIDSK
jgi:C-terminal processing protease CtpA/Prc/tricorn protease-like protein